MAYSDARVSRRGFLRAAVGTGAVAGAADSAAAQATHTVEMTDQLVFDPESLTIAPGDTVVWENVGTIAHTVTAYGEEIPDEADYFASGGFDSESAARSAYPEGEVTAGESYQHTFEVEGQYGYFCIPHESAGMVASLTVGEGGGGGGGTPGGGGGPAIPNVPGSARLLGVAAAVSMATVVGLAYFFLKYGGDYGTTE